MSFFEALLALHILAAATWFGSNLAVTMVARRLLDTDPAGMAGFGPAAGWWAGRAHPAAGVVLLATGIGLVLDAGFSFGDAWITIGMVGLIGAMGLGGAVIGPTADRMNAAPEAERPALARRLVTAARIELLILAVVIVDMVVKPGL